MKRSELLLRTALVTALSFGAFWAYSKYVPFSLVWNRTASIPLGIYFAEETGRRTVPAGALACFPYRTPTWAKERQYFPEGFTLCKHVAGLPTETVVQKDGAWAVVAANGTTRAVGVKASADSRGRPLPQDALKEGPIPPGMVVMAAPAKPNSLDSRYLGLIPQADLRLRIYPLITW